MDKEVTADRICAAIDDFVTMASDNTYRLYLVELTLDDVGVTGGVKEFYPYSDDCKNVHDMYISNGTLSFAQKRDNKDWLSNTSVLLSNGTPFMHGCTRHSPIWGPERWR